MAGRALPSHLKPSAAEGGEGGFAPRHHGKTQSHVVSLPLIVQMHGASCLVRVSWASAVMAPSCKLPAAGQVLSACFLCAIWQALPATRQEQLVSGGVAEYSLWPGTSFVPKDHLSLKLSALAPSLHRLFTASHDRRSSLLPTRAWI